ncbi:hypothetical protein [Nocardioides litoris]|uniref:hypothetical protein n=1 Tax=Nocardioides litoris TaxID=1926648 RepID=UPI0011244862|nr:hypothetical protein [Nocardioides litoris]
MSADRDDELAALWAERNALEARAVEAELMAEQLAEQLADAQRRLADRAAQADQAAHAAEADQPSPAAAPAGSGASDLGLFDGSSAPRVGARYALDGSDRSVLPIGLGAVALVAFLVCVLSVVVSGFSILGVVLLVLAGVLGWAAYRTRYVPRSVTVEDGVVVVKVGDDAKRFDLRNDGVKVDVQGTPGQDWRVRFYRRALDPVDVDESMTDPDEFLRVLRQHRPGL